MIMRTTGQVRFLKSGRLALWPLAIGLFLAPVSGTALAHPGALDKSFSRDGRALAAVGVENRAIGYLEGHNWMSAAVATAVGPEGRIFVAGERTVVAFRRSGKVDRRFGNNGRVNLPIVGEGQTVIKDVAVDPSERILVLAAARFANGGGQTIVARLSASGSFDTSFADHGILLTDFGVPAPQTGPNGPAGAPIDVLPDTFAIDGQERVVIAGTAVAAIAYCRDGGEQPHHAAYLARLLPDGSLDPSFGKGGLVLDEREPFYVEQHPYMGGLAIDGNTIFYATDQNESANCEGFGGGLLVRLGEAGTRDASFGSAGVRGITPQDSRPQHIAIDRWGHILVLRNATSKETEYGPGFEVVSRWNADGTLDAGFGNGGETVVKLPGEESDIDALAVDPQGRPLLAGRVAPPRTLVQVKHHAYAPPRFVLVRLRASGQPDRTFGMGGRVITGFGSGSRAAATDIAIRGRSAIVAGPVLSPTIHGGQGFAVARYRPDS